MRQNTQLMYTLFLGAVILGAFTFMAWSFVGIARDSQNRLEDIRFASLQDAFVQFVEEEMDNPQSLTEKITNISNVNTTIRDFYVLDVRGEEVIVSSLDTSLVGKTPKDVERIPIGLAQFDPKNSYRSEIVQNGERMFFISRGVTNERGQVVAVVFIRHTLSEADKAVAQDIRNSIFLFIFVMLIIMFLFFRHSKIIDYAYLYKKLREIDQLKDDFISMASHELRSPLTVIRGYAEYLHDTKQNLDEDQNDFVEKIQVSAKELDNLVADMLDVSRIEQGRMKFEYAVVDPKVTIEDVVERFEQQAKAQGLSLAYANDGTAEIRVDVGRLKQVLINMVSNAIKYTEKGDVVVKSYVENNKFIIRISDTGLGMSKEEQDQLFQKFSRVGGTRTKHIRGTGLGLWISKQIISEMNGTITVESIKGKGSDFILKFPVVGEK